MAEPLIDVTGLGKSYGGLRVVQGVTLTLARGEIVGLVGANGGGKTTTLRMFAGLILADDGCGTVLGRDIRRGQGCGIGYMPQRLSLYPELTVRENLRFRAELHDIPRHRIDELVERLGITTMLATRFDRLSGGWARRVQFAATMLPAPAAAARRADRGARHRHAQRSVALADRSRRAGFTIGGGTWTRCT
ncbi:ABC transporter ATP-binding protein [Sphingomonas naphthae]|uniref:ABC transporter ATP-binding protein n=1 Tax=Sphingomonas naphthae TaxID=1813468 RepID=A0ABY7TND6_9SPHN|nr:ABC transporter ATP-binding protein [Sphingomonas naphthae]WCT74496.1 ABC transporter ATP-binding protein [Sphingomonas naphthae]